MTTSPPISFRASQAKVKRLSRLVTTPTPDETCRRCGSLLFPPHLAPGMMIPAAASFVCLNCGRAYQWTGTPPRLSIVAPDVEGGEDEDD
jgi:hypothetical protein